MAVYNKFDRFTLDVLNKKHDFLSDVFKVMLTNTAPVPTNTVRANIPEVAPLNGYPSGGVTVPVTVVTSGGISRVFGTEQVITANGGTIGPFRYVVLYNWSSPTQPLISWFDYGTTVTLQNTETFTVRFDPINGIFDIQ